MDAAKALFWKYGIVKVTVEEICEHAEVSKMTFYRNFDNKKHVAEKVLTAIAAKSMHDYRRIMDSDIPFNKKIQKIVKLKHDASKDLSDEFVRDVYSTEESDLRNVIEKFQKKSLQELREDLSKAQANGDIRKDLNLDFVIYWLNSMREKMLDKQLTSMFGSTQELAVELTNFIFYGIMPKENR